MKEEENTGSPHTVGHEKNAGHKAAPRSRGDRLRQVCSLLTIVAVMLSVAVQRDGRLLGHDLRPQAPGATDTAALASAASPFDAADTAASPSGASAPGASSSTTVISTAELGKDIIGFNGPTPLTITLEGGRITAVIAQANEETPGFFRMVEGVLLPKWVGMTPQEALATEVDAVSGATYSSRAVIANVRLAMQQLADEAQAAQGLRLPDWLTAKLVCVIVVIVLGAVLPLLSWRSRRTQKAVRTAQLVLNVVVLGLWSGTFLSCSSIVSFLSNGLVRADAVVILLLLIVAFVYPLFGRSKHYCGNLCPLGSLQELAGLTRRRKWRMSPTLARRLVRLKEIIWAVLMVLMWSGLWLRWMDYELFVAFLFRQASPVIIAVAVAFVLLAVVVPRPYCRFLCPTGQLMKMSYNIK